MLRFQKIGVPFTLEQLRQLYTARLQLGAKLAKKTIRHGLVVKDFVVLQSGELGGIEKRFVVIPKIFECNCQQQKLGISKVQHLKTLPFTGSLSQTERSCKKRS